MTDKDFVSFLVEETLKLQQSGEGNLSSLDLKLSDYDLSYMKGEFIPQSCMLRFVTPFGLLDIPANWSCFDLECTSHGHVLLDKNNDADHFLEVIKEAWDKTIEMLLIIHSDGFCYLVGLKEGDEGHLHDLVHRQQWLKSA
jgi:hypothetical protein